VENYVVAPTNLFSMNKKNTYKELQKDEVETSRLENNLKNKMVEKS
jgi:hypothetical protein